VTPDEGQLAWREAVRAFRLAAAVLEDPAPTLFADLADPEVLSYLGREPALVHFSPFDALPNDTAHGRSELARQSSGKRGRITVRPPGRGTARPRDDWPQVPHPPDGPKDVPRPAPGSGASVAEPPSFSFRRSGASGASTEQRQPSQRDKDGRGSATHWSAPPGDRDREGATTAEARSDRDARAYSGATTDGRDAEAGRGAGDVAPGALQPVHPMTLLKGLAEDALRAAEPRAHEDPVRPSSVSTPRPVGSRESTLEAHDDGAAALIGSLAERLLTPKARVAGSAPATGTGEDGVARSGTPRPWEQPGEEKVLGRPSLSFPGGADREPASESPSGSDWPDADPIADPFAEAASDRHSDRHPDAAALAALVNDVLVRQARRHGVDLS
jgi:hypothetical protein